MRRRSKPSSSRDPGVDQNDTFTNPFTSLSPEADSFFGSAPAVAAEQVCVLGAAELVVKIRNGHTSAIEHRADRVSESLAVAVEQTLSRRTARPSSLADSPQSSLHDGSSRSSLAAGVLLSHPDYETDGLFEVLDPLNVMLRQTRTRCPAAAPTAAIVTR